MRRRIRRPLQRNIRVPIKHIVYSDALKRPVEEDPSVNSSYFDGFFFAPEKIAIRFELYELFFR